METELTIYGSTPPATCDQSGVIATLEVEERTLAWASVPEGGYDPRYGSIRGDSRISVRGDGRRVIGVGGSCGGA
jgi:hypothetical protein